MALLVFMARNKSREKRNEFRYQIYWNGSNVPHQVSAYAFNRAIASSWVIETGEKTAVVARGVKATLHAGALCLEDLAEKALIWIYTSWISIDRDSPVIQGEYYMRDIQKEYGNLRSKRVEPDGTWIDRCDWKVSL